MDRSFLGDYISSAIEASRNDFIDNYDVRRFGPDSTLVRGNFRWVRDSYCFLLKKLNLVSEIEAKILTNKAVAHVAPHIIDFEWLYKRLEDDESRKFLVDVQLYKALGERRVKLPLNNKDYWAKIETAEKLASGAESMELGFMGWKAYKMSLNSIGYPLQLFLPPLGVVHSLLLQPYRCQTVDSVIEVSEGDIVIDAGGCYGETALDFALKAGGTGQVFSFEFMPENLAVFHRNMQLNPNVAQRVKLIEKPLWEHSGEKLYIEGSGPGTRVRFDTTDPDARRVETISIDDLVHDLSLAKLDFIKMDIEGAELQALKGAEKSIRQFRPKMAISIYHKPEDFWTIPQYIAGLGLGYRFALRHFTIHSEETVLFAF
jgi:FkbM family methyltransferase